MSTSVLSGGGVKLQARIAAHVHAWEALKRAHPSHCHECLPFITISREIGCEAQPLADRLVEILNERCRPSIPWVAYDHEVVDRVAQELHLARNVVDSLDGKRRDEMSELFNAVLNVKVDESVVFRKTAEVIRSLAAHGNAVLVGRGSYLITQDLKTGLHVRLVAPQSWRVHKTACDAEISLAEAERQVQEADKERAHFFKTFFVQDAAHPFCHDLLINNSQFNLAQIAEIVFAALSARFGEILVGD
jgi:cytidylate kinase